MKQISIKSINNKEVRTTVLKGIGKARYGCLMNKNKSAMEQYAQIADKISKENYMFSSNELNKIDRIADKQLAKNAEELRAKAQNRNEIGKMAIYEYYENYNIPLRELRREIETEIKKALPEELNGNTKITEFISKAEMQEIEKQGSDLQ